ncbi:TetR/AcrR family transcriptional regulator [Trinickia violacea]|nr:TetR/AcrR family transcriptional regulator [Trinickia violacea]
MNTSVRKSLRNSVRHRAGAPVFTGLVAGILATLINTGMLIVADRLHIVTARGGLLTLLLKLAGPLAPPIATTWSFQQLFHIVVGVAMAVVYALTLGSVPGAVLAKGLVVAAAIAKEAGVPNGSLFTYFPTKVELFNALYIEIKEELISTVDDGLSNAGTSANSCCTYGRGGLGGAQPMARSVEFSPS